MGVLPAGLRSEIIHQRPSFSPYPLIMAVVMVCADNSKHSDYALDYYLKHIHREGNTVKVAHCPEYWQNIGPMEGPSPGRVQELIQETNVATAALAEKISNTLKAANVAGEFVKLEGKEPWEEVCKAAKEQNCNLIVIGTRGQGTLKRSLLGSVSDSVLHHTHIPVLVCRHQ